MAIWIVGAFVKIAVFYYAAVLGTAQRLKLSDYRTLIWPLSIIWLNLPIGPFRDQRYRAYLMTVFPLYGPFVQTIIPLFLLVVAVIRKRKKEKDDGER